ncbi:hypothetical protein COSHB9_12980 [Companilactobacillus alimentarius]|uniref:Immunity protein n=1 Tax=Companilactobacillus alimentarius DSM 20249 TaxID=1423720 RepID=A0A2K9HFF8_9LACO|nr:hypothetical protein [Companilactobacillus alimentarius]AUI71291.1 hypothetical protein LA20249_03345 [Companilactobacillus alimentarius DSM 20249]KRK75431.1 hypothetical protein FC67_GL001949 [Companilactobacillus alimentarius DSM 20249]MDT6951428.1 hypothetical protein [Companilactobacillus alimentarius]GEO43784.1 hypothetical protein LAL01_00160 [Companilactobacillus alimentarius]
MSKVDIVVAILFIIIGIWQIFISVKYFKYLKQNANKDTSRFVLLAVWSSFIIGLFLFVIGISAFF